MQLIIDVAPIMQVTHVCNKIVTLKDVTLCDKSVFPYNNALLLKERIRSLWEQILSFKRNSHFEKGCNCREALLDTVVSLWCA